MRAAESIGPLPAPLRYLKTDRWGQPQPEYVTPVIQAGRQVFSDYFTCQLNSAAKIVMPVLGKERILLVRWLANRAGAASEVFLWDEPALSTWIVRLPKDILQTPERAAIAIQEMVFLADVSRFSCGKPECVH